MMKKQLALLLILYGTSIFFSGCMQEPNTQKDDSIKTIGSTADSLDSLGPSEPASGSADVNLEDINLETINTNQDNSNNQPAIPTPVEEKSGLWIDKNNNQTQGNSTMTPTEKTKLAAPDMIIDQKKEYTAILNTELGAITIKLNAAQTPITVNNFIYLAQNNFYNDTIFHRTIDGFMIQGGDPLGTGAGGPGYRFDDEKFTGEYKRGIVAMANAGPNTNGSQFFIMHKDYPLPANYVIFGQVTDGIEIVDKIATAPTKPGGEGSSPVKPVAIKTVEITQK